MKHDMPEQRLEVIVELFHCMVRREFGSELAVVYVEGGDFEAYQRTIAKIEALPIHLKRATVVWVSLEGAELLRYPSLDVEFIRSDGKQKLGVTGDPERVAETLRLIGGQSVDGEFFTNKNERRPSPLKRPKRRTDR